MLGVGASIVWRDFVCELDVDDVLRAQGADPAIVRARGSSAVEVAEQALALGLPLLAPAAVARSLSVRSFRHDVVLLNGGRLSGSFVSQRLSGACEVVVLVSTVGSGIETLSRQCFDDQPALALALDALGSVGVDRVTNEARARVGQVSAERGFLVTAPATPGDAEWPVNEGQPQVFALADASTIGVELTSSCMMTPQKSTSMVLGLGPDVTLDDRGECERCDLADRCKFRGLHEGSVPPATQVARLP